MTNKIKVNLPDKSYTIYVGSNVLNKIGEQLEKKKILIVSNPTIYELYGTDLIDALSNCEVDKFLIPDGEKYKTINTVFGIYDYLLDSGFDRKSYIIALGGGVIGDIAGFVASTYMRGIPYIQVPTTLLAQVDSSIGGKVAVNHPKAKNVIGSFYQPTFVYSDIKTLETLPDEEFTNGMAEVIKYSLIKDRTLFELLEENDRKSIKNGRILLQIVSRCAQIKTDIVEKDEKEKDLRMILNFGHTIGHALEAISGYTLKHGSAISIGMVVAIKMSVKKGLLKEKDENRILNLFKKYNLPIYTNGFDINEIYDIMKYDKKVFDNKIHFIMLESIGKALIHDNIPAELLLKSLSEVCLNEK